MHDLSDTLHPLGLSAWRYLSVTGSTNDDSLAWAHEGALDWSLVVADAQTAGRGRGNRHWVTEPGCGLAFSLVVRPSPAEIQFFPRFTALAALGLISALSDLGVVAELKWPNDVLLGRKKVAGVLVEADWQDGQVSAVVVGMGVNVTLGSVPQSESLRYPATAIETALGRPVDRWVLLGDILSAMRDYRANLTEELFVDAWNMHLAFRDETVRFRMGNNGSQCVKVLGVNADGQLLLEHENGDQFTTPTGEILMIDEVT